jgi:hypothetical protein
VFESAAGDELGWMPPDLESPHDATFGQISSNARARGSHEQTRPELGVAGLGR